MSEKLSLSQVGFDPRWPHPRNPKTGTVSGYNGTRIIVKQAAGGKGSVSLYEFPVKSGLFYKRCDSPDGKVFMELDEVESADGIRKRDDAERYAKRSDLEKADAQLKSAQSQYSKAKTAADAEAKANAASAKKDQE